MMNLRGPIGIWVATAVAAVALLIAALLAPERLRALVDRGRGWLLGLALIASAVLFLLVLPRAYPPQKRLADSALPTYFLPYFWAWMLVAILGLAGSSLTLWRLLRPSPSVRSGGPLDEAWAALLARLGQARVDLARQPVHLVLAPDGDVERKVGDLVRAADLRIVAEAPAGPAPVHAFVVPEGALLCCDGAWAGGLHADGAVRLDDLGRKLRARGPGRPVVTGLAVLFPIDWADRPQSLDQAAVAGEGVQILYDALQVRCPVLALFSGLETVPGSAEFIRRMAAIDPRKTEIRVGFEVPGSRPLDRDLARGAIDWIASWFHAGVLDLLAAGPLDYRGNTELVGFVTEFRGRRRRLAQLLEVAFLPLPHDDEPILFRGGYFAASGDGPGARAFVPGLFLGPRRPILSGRHAAPWTAGAIRGDARYRWAALGLGLAVALPSAFVWRHVVSRNGVVGWVGLVALASAWAIVLLWPRLARGRADRAGDPRA
jgi:hypothetical protein